MALIRGVKSKFPCPICLVPQDDLSVHSSVPHALCTSSHSQDILNTARARRLQEERESDLKGYSLRDVEVSSLYVVAHLPKFLLIYWI
jgi:hypothetical protein